MIPVRPWITHKILLIVFVQLCVAIPLLISPRVVPQVGGSCFPYGDYGWVCDDSYSSGDWGCSGTEDNGYNPYEYDNGYDPYDYGSGYDPYDYGGTSTGSTDWFDFNSAFHDYSGASDFYGSNSGYNAYDYGSGYDAYDYSGGWDWNFSINEYFGSSVNLKSGNLYHSQKVGPLTFAYNSLDPYDGPLGSGWTHNYNLTITQNPDGSLFLKRRDGNTIYFSLDYDGVFHADAKSGDTSSIVKNADGSYTQTTKYGKVRTFDASGRLISLADRNGNGISLSYNGNDLAGLTYSTGRTIQITVNAGKIVSITDFAGRTYHISYTGDSLSTITDPEGNSWQYLYDAIGRMAKKTDPVGNTTSYAYDGNGMIASSTDSQGGVKTIAYDTTQGIAWVTRTDGGAWTHKYDPGHAVPLEVTDSLGNTRTYAYDSRRRLISKTLPDGSTKSFTYDENGNVTSLTDALGNAVLFTYNELNRITSITDRQGNKTVRTYDEKGNLSSTTDPTGKTTELQRDERGNITSVTISGNRTTSYVYDQYNQIIGVVGPTGATAGFIRDASGVITGITDGNGNTTQIQYNATNRPVKVTDPQGNFTAYTYDANGRRASRTDANGNTTYYDRNDKGRLTKITDALGNTTTFAYGGSGCASCGGGAEKLVSVTDPNGNTIHFEYDLIGRMIKTTDALGNSTAYTYNAEGKLLAATDANGNIASFAYDSLGRLDQATDPLDGVVGLEYSPNGKITKVTDALGNATGYENDASGRVTRTTSPDAGTTIYAYNPDGTLRTKSDGRGITATYSYDASGRPLKVEYPDPSENSSYTYDSPASQNGKGRLTAVTDPSGTAAYDYDTLGRVVKETKVILGVTYITKYEYDRIGNPVAITYPSGRRVLSGFDAVRRPVSITEKMGGKSISLAPAISYDKDGHIADLLYGNGIHQQWTYNANGKVSWTGLSSPPWPTSISPSFSYHYDKVGNIANITDNSYGVFSQTYTYDPLNRLEMKSDILGEQTFSYDANGNRLTQTRYGNPESYSYGGNRLSSVTTSLGPINQVRSFSYDQNGSTLNDGVQEFVYDQNSRPSAVFQGSRMVAQYAYNARGQRIIKKVASCGGTSTTTVFHHDLWGRLLEETTAKGGLISDYVYLGARPLAMIKKKGSSEAVYYYHCDHLLTPRVMTDARKLIVWEIISDPFGKTDIAWGTVQNNLRFPGQYFDQETGLNYNWYRYYDARTGRYTQSDPIGLLAGMNPYVYVGGNPINRVDPTGETPTAALGGIFGGAFGLAWSVGSQVAANPNSPIDWGAVAEASVSGAISGAITGATFGLGPVGTAVAGAAMGGLSGLWWGSFDEASPYNPAKPNWPEPDPCF